MSGARREGGEGGRGALAGLVDRFPPYLMLTIAVTGAVVSAAGGWFTLGARQEKLADWRIEHLEHHRERAAAIAAEQAGVRKELEGVTALRRQVDELTFRLGAAEENARGTAEAIVALQASVNQQAGDIRVMREILERLDQRRAALDLPGGGRAQR